MTGEGAAGGGSTAHRAEGTRHTGGVTSVCLPNRPTWVSVRERSSSCVCGGCQEARAPCCLSPPNTSQLSTPADLHVSHRWVRGFLWPVWELLVARGLGIEQVGKGAQLEVVPV